MSEDKTVAALKDYLNAQPAGSIADTDTLASLLAPCWDQFAGSDESRMKAYKLKGRIEAPAWDSPCLEFWIERHGETAMGSTRATTWKWTVNLQKMTASPGESKRRQVEKMDKRLDVKPLAEVLAKAIINGTLDERLKVLKDGRVRVEIGKIIPETNKQTTSGRRRRFQRQLEELLGPHGWVRVRPNVYSRQS